MKGLRIFAYIISFITIAIGPQLISGKGAEADSLFHVVENLSGNDMLDKADSLAAAGNPERALSLYMTIADWPEESQPAEITQVMRVRACLGAGNVMNTRCNFAEALNYYVRGLILSEKLPGHPFSATIYKNIGNVYSGLDDFENGNIYYRKGLEICRQNPDTDLEKRLLFNLIVNLTAMEEPAEAERYRQMERQAGPDTDSLSIFHEPYLDGLVLYAKKDFRGAVPKFREAVKLAMKGNLEPRFVCAAWKELSKAYDELSMRDSAFLCLEKCDEIIHRENIAGMFPSVPRRLAEYYAERGDGPKASLYRSEYLTLRDSLSNERKFSTANNMLFQYRASKTASEIQSLYRQKKETEQSLARHKRLLLTIMLVLLTVCGALLVFYIQKRRITRSYRSLYEMSRNYARSKELMDRRHSSDLQRIEDAESEIARLSGEGKAEPVQPQQEQSAKYSSSNLDSQLRSRLAREIETFMASDAAEYCSPDFSLERLAKAIGSNSKYVSQTINEEFGKNFNAFTNDYRIKLACDRLASAEYQSYTIKFIGESVGFKSHSTFTDAFNKVTGLSPSVYRRMARQENS